MNNIVDVKGNVERKVKCAWCEILDYKRNMVQEVNKKYYHAGKCHEKYLENVQYKKVESEKMELLKIKITDVYKLVHSSHIPINFYKDLSTFRNEFKHPYFLDGLLKGYDACQERIENARSNKEFSEIYYELKYGLSIVRAWMSNKLNNYNLKKYASKTGDFELSEEQKINLQSYKLESLIEEKLLIALLYDNHDKYSIEIFTQIEFEINKRKYRVDFLIESKIHNKRYIIECDGHDFHEATKEQASRDKQRDRDFLTINIPTIRFSGSEIWYNPKLCVEEIMSIIQN
jgi:very-short-patch-repair endonuclease